METIKRITFVLFFTLCFVNANAQQNEYSKIIQAFKNSYIKESAGDLTAAINELKTVYSEDAYEINLRLGWLYYSQGAYTLSEGFYSRAIALKPFALEPKFGICYPQSALGYWDKVLKIYQDILLVSPNNTSAMHQLGLIYYARKDYTEAEKLFSKVVNLYPFDYDGLVMLGWTNFQLKKFREAKVLFSKALMNKPTDASALEGLSLVN